MKPVPASVPSATETPQLDRLLEQVRPHVEAAKQHNVYANVVLGVILKTAKADANTYGQDFIGQCARALDIGKSDLRRALRVVERIPQAELEKLRATKNSKGEFLSWKHFVTLTYADDAKRQGYEDIALAESLTAAELRKRIGPARPKTNGQGMKRLRRSLDRTVRDLKGISDYLRTQSVTASGDGRTIEDLSALLRVAETVETSATEIVTQVNDQLQFATPPASPTFAASSAQAQSSNAGVVHGGSAVAAPSLHAQPVFTRPDLVTGDRIAVGLEGAPTPAPVATPVPLPTYVPAPAVMSEQRFAPGILPVPAPVPAHQPAPAFMLAPVPVAQTRR